MLGKERALLSLTKHARRAVRLVMGPSRLLLLTTAFRSQDRISLSPSSRIILVGVISR